MRAALPTYQDRKKFIDAIKVSDFGIFIINEFRGYCSHSAVTDDKAIDLTLWQLP